MKPNKFSTKAILWSKFPLAIFVLALLISACQGPLPAPTQTNSPVSTISPSATPTATTPTTEEIVPTAGIDADTPPDQAGIENIPTADTSGESLGTDQGGGLILPTDETGLDTLPTDQTGIDLFPTDETDFTGSGTDEPDTGNFTTTRTPNRFPGSATGQSPSLENAFGQTPEPNPTTEFQPTPANIPLGDPGNPIKMGVVSGADADPSLLDSSQMLVAQLSQDTGYTIEVQQVNSYTELLNGMQIGAVHMAWLQPFTYILASRRGYARSMLVTNHFGVYSYGTQFLANTKSQFAGYYDANQGKSSTPASEALAQFADKRPCFVDPLSASGYIAPAGLLAQQQVNILAPVFLQSHTAVVRALYIEGICDFGATFAIYGDPRTATTIQQDLPDVMQKVVVIWQSGEIIPNLNLSFQSQVPEDMSKKITQDLLDLVLGEDGRQLISSANGYDIQDLKQIDDKYYDPLRELVKASRVNLITLIGK